jgi:hypothetical protein
MANPELWIFPGGVRASKSPKQALLGLEEVPIEALTEKRR